ncbi:hypothetical protein D3C81_1269620 [compost metagenome]
MAALTDEHGMDVFDIARVPVFQYRQQTAGRDVVVGLEGRKACHANTGKHQPVQCFAIAGLHVAQWHDVVFLAPSAHRPARLRTDMVTGEQVVSAKFFRMEGQAMGGDVRG